MSLCLCSGGREEDEGDGRALSMMVSGKGPRRHHHSICRLQLDLGSLTRVPSYVGDIWRRVGRCETGFNRVIDRENGRFFFSFGG